MNPLLRWVTKIIRIFRPAPAPVAVPKTQNTRVIEAKTTIVEMERPRSNPQAEIVPMQKPEPIPSPNPAPEPVMEAPICFERLEQGGTSEVAAAVPSGGCLGEKTSPLGTAAATSELPPVQPALQEEPSLKPLKAEAPLPASKQAERSPKQPREDKTPIKKVVEKFAPQPVFTGRVELTPDLDNPARLRQIKGVISVEDIANRELLDLVPYEPGKPVDDVAREIGLDPASIIKLASNENPLGPSPLAMAAMHKAIETSHFYPDGGGFHLRNAIAHAFGLGRENVVLGNGSNEIIELLFHTFTRPGIHEIITARHAFAVYTLMAQLFGVHAIVVDDVDFTPDLPAMLRAVTPQTRLIFLASPNNPTGTRVTNEALDAFLRDLPPHVIAVLDEAYYEFLDNPPDTVGYVKNGARVVLMRTFSKIQGLAGLRVGYGLAPAEIANLLQRARQPFNANSIAQAGAMAGLADLDHQKKTKAITDEGRRVIEDAFAKMGLKYIPSSANFIMVHVGDGGEVFKRLMKKGIIVRSMVSYHLPEYIRVSIGTPEQNARFLAELPNALVGRKWTAKQDIDE